MAAGGGLAVVLDPTVELADYAQSAGRVAPAEVAAEGGAVGEGDRDLQFWVREEFGVAEDAAADRFADRL